MPADLGGIPSWKKSEGGGDDFLAERLRQMKEREVEVRSILLEESLGFTLFKPTAFIVKGEKT
jgi:hypothetical protein